MSTLILCDGADLAEECGRRASALGLKAEIRAAEDPIHEILEQLGAGASWKALGLLLSTPPEIEPFVRLAEETFEHKAKLAVATLLPSSADRRYADANLAGDLGVSWLNEIRPLVATLALSGAGEHPWTASTRALSATDRLRLGRSAGSAKTGRWRRVGEVLVFERASRQIPVGEPPDVAAALAALDRAQRTKRPAMPRVEGVDPIAVRDVIFGPARALSDPASKAALEPYDVPFPIEELCGSPSRAAAEATRIGFPVRLALASPDLRVWEHPDLAAESIDNAARVRDVFRQVTALAQQRAPDARVLGVTVSAATPAQALLELHLRPVDPDLVLLTVAFADPHGRASKDRTTTILPATSESIARALRRLSGSALLLGVMPNEQTRSLGELVDVLLRLAAFTHEWRDEVESVAVQPLAVLPGGEVEAREVCILVSDAFTRSLQAAAGS